MQPSSVPHPDGGGFTSCQHLPTTDLKYINNFFLGAYNSIFFISTIGGEKVPPLPSITPKLRIAEIHLTSLPLTHVINAQQKHLVKEIMMNTFLRVSLCIMIFTGNNNKQTC